MSNGTVIICGSAGVEILPRIRRWVPVADTFNYIAKFDMDALEHDYQIPHREAAIFRGVLDDLYDCMFDGLHALGFDTWTTQPDWGQYAGGAGVRKNDMHMIMNNYTVFGFGAHLDGAHMKRHYGIPEREVDRITDMLTDGYRVLVREFRRLNVPYVIHVPRPENFVAPVRAPQ